MVYRDSEKEFHDMLFKDCKSGLLLKVYELPEALSVHREYQVGRCIIDVLIFHVDGSITCIECKREGLGLRDYLTGIGQLLHAKTQIGFSLFARGEFTKVRAFLAVPSAVDGAVGFACSDAGVCYMPCGTMDEHRR